MEGIAKETIHHWLITQSKQLCLLIDAFRKNMYRKRKLTIADLSKRLKRSRKSIILWLNTLKVLWAPIYYDPDRWRQLLDRFYEFKLEEMTVNMINARIN